MSSPHRPLVFHYSNVLGQQPPAIFSQRTTPGLDKPEGFRIPLIYFSWAVLEGSRSAHHHPDSDELLLILSGKAKVLLFGPPSLLSARRLSVCLRRASQPPAAVVRRILSCNMVISNRT